MVYVGFEDETDCAAAAVAKNINITIKNAQR